MAGLCACADDRLAATSSQSRPADDIQEDIVFSFGDDPSSLNISLNVVVDSRRSAACSILLVCSRSFRSMLDVKNVLRSSGFHVDDFP